MGERGPIPEPENIRALKSRKKDVKSLKLVKTSKVPTYSRTPSPPSWLDDRGAAYWRQLAPSAIKLKTLDKLSASLFGVLCDSLAMTDAMRSAIEAEGLQVEGPKGRMVPHPLLKPLRDSIRITNDLLRDFGLTEVGRRRLHIVTSEPEADPLETFLRGGK